MSKANIEEFEVAKKKAKKRLIRNLIIAITIALVGWYYGGIRSRMFLMPKDDFAYQMYMVFPVIAIVFLVDRAFDTWDKIVARLNKQYGLVDEHE